MADDSRYLQISAPVQSGNSGGPLLDQSGNLVGVVSAKLNALKVALKDGDLPQNVNFAVKAAILQTFLNSNRVPFQEGSVAPKPRR
jgi:S1-C subfamily serine protease